MDSVYIWSYLIGAIIWAFIWGFASRAVILNKGYDEEEATKWFWLGFFFSFIAIIVAATKPNENTNYSASRTGVTSTVNWDNVVPVGGWRCQKCGKANQGYVSICSCGAKKGEIIQERGKDKQGKNNQRNNISEAERIKHLKEYKELLDTGIITQEEFEKKKTQLLWENTIEIGNEINEEEENEKNAKKEGFDGINPKGEKAVYLLPADRDDFGVCPRCGATQQKNRHICLRCSVPLMYDEEK